MVSILNLTQLIGLEGKGPKLSPLLVTRPQNPSFLVFEIQIGKICDLQIRPRVIMSTNTILGMLFIFYIQCSILPFSKVANGNLESPRDMLQTGGHIAKDYTQRSEHEDQPIQGAFHEWQSYGNMGAEVFGSTEGIPRTQLEPYADLEGFWAGSGGENFQASNHPWDTPHASSLSSLIMGQTTESNILQVHVPQKISYPDDAEAQWGFHDGYQSGYQNQEHSQITSLAPILEWDSIMPNKLKDILPDAHSSQQNCWLLGGHEFFNGQWDSQKYHDSHVEEGTYGPIRPQTPEFLIRYHSSNAFPNFSEASASIRGSSLSSQGQKQASIGHHVPIPEMENVDMLKHIYDSPLYLGDTQLAHGPNTLSSTRGTMEHSMSNHDSSLNLDGPNGSSSRQSVLLPELDSSNYFQDMFHSGNSKQTYRPQALPGTGVKEPSMLHQDSTLKMKGQHESSVRLPMPVPEMERFDDIQLIRDSSSDSGNIKLPHEAKASTVTGNALQHFMLHHNRNNNNPERLQDFESDELLNVDHSEDIPDKIMHRGPTLPILGEENHTEHSLDVLKMQEMHRDKGNSVFEALDAATRRQKNKARRILEVEDENFDRIAKKQKIQSEKKVVYSQAIAQTTTYSSEDQAREAEEVHMPKGLTKSKKGEANMSPNTEPEKQLITWIVDFGKRRLGSSAVKVEIIDPWFSKLEGIITKKFAPLPYYLDKISDYISSFMIMLGNQLIGSFLGMVILTTHGCHEVSDSVLDASILAGFEFIRGLIDEWSTLDIENSFKKHLDRKHHPYNDGTQPHALLKNLASLPFYGFMSMKKLWKLWLRWYRDKSSPKKRFFAVQSHLAYELQKCMHQMESKTSVAEESPAGNLWEFQNHAHPYHHLILLELPPLHTGPYPNLTDKRRAASSKHIPADLKTLLRVIRGVGRVEMQLLEHYEPVGMWFDDLSEALHSQLLSFDSNTQAISTDPHQL
ncbi:hypothetical protein CROQUDRAFT_94315 [Cronartium quercuum f. sp. fusiforme G11]|uniref:Uncharacterized protein n=1 Tax=Cronartium quercuum f. sp. fusiforme G11 TaxID=708437 RepID=A0A9P6TAY3_9BASI|nr:hypothetical protein CROQUDRAFT_94315 [Cronartium quercuum f. sp. fusiforme G11]